MALLVGRAATVAVAAFTALIVAAVPAWATVFVAVFEGDTVWITSNSAGDTITVTCQGGMVDVAMTSTPSLACDDMTSLNVDANSGADTVDLSGVTLAAFPKLEAAAVDVSDTFADVVTGTEGRDVITADGKDTVTAGVGDDWVDGAESVSAGPGDDWVEGADTASGDEGDDVLRDTDQVQGGPGDDRIVDPGAGGIAGGEGHDVVVADYTRSAAQFPLTLAISDTTLAGIDATGIEQYDITTSTGAWNDSIDSRAYSGVLDVETLDGNDTVRGGPGVDVVDGGAGNDALAPGPGADVVRGGTGDDSISVRDGLADSVSCGDGFDTVVADRADVLIGCESVSLPPPETNPIVGPKKVKKGKKPAFTFGSPAAGAQFECAIDSGPFKPCESPHHVKTKKLSEGKHTLSVRAIQPAGNADPTPSTFRFKVLPKNK
jgi:Ca2+-binding RTX toxin-like protein